MNRLIIKAVTLIGGPNPCL